MHIYSCHFFSGSKRLLTFILLELKVIGHCHQYRARPACTYVQFDQALYCWLTNFKFSTFDILKTDNGEFQKWMADYSILKI